MVRVYFIFYFYKLNLRIVSSLYFWYTWHSHVSTLRKRSPYSNLFWSAFFPHFPVFSSNAGKCGKNVDQNNSECGQFLRSAQYTYSYTKICNDLQNCIIVILVMHSLNITLLILHYFSDPIFFVALFGFAYNILCCIK